MCTICGLWQACCILGVHGGCREGATASGPGSRDPGSGPARLGAANRSRTSLVSGTTGSRGFGRTGSLGLNCIYSPLFPIVSFVIKRNRNPGDYKVLDSKISPHSLPRTPQCGAQQMQRVSKSRESQPSSAVAAKDLRLLSTVLWPVPTAMCFTCRGHTRFSRLNAKKGGEINY